MNSDYLSTPTSFLTFYDINQLFSTFWASSPGKWQIFKLLSALKFFKLLCPRIMCLTQKHQIHAQFAWIIVFLLIKLNNLGLFEGDISKYLISIIFQAVKRDPSPGTGTRPVGWEFKRWHKWPLNNDHLSTTATIFGSRGWSLYTELTVCSYHFEMAKAVV